MNRLFSIAGALFFALLLSSFAMASTPADKAFLSQDNQTQNTVFFYWMPEFSQAPVPIAVKSAALQSNKPISVRSDADAIVLGVFVENMGVGRGSGSGAALINTVGTLKSKSPVKQNQKMVPT